MRRRRFIPIRQAYEPRMWPWVALAMALSAVLGAIAFSVISPIWLAIVVTIGDGIGCGQIPRIRYELWMRKHPAMSHAEYMRTIERWAPWN